MMHQRQKNIRRTVVLLLAFIALITGLFVSQHIFKSKKIDISKFNGTVLHSPREVNSFKLTGVDNKPFDNNALKGKWTMVFFGFTNCGYLCPTTMAELGKMYRLLEEDHVKKLPKVVMISIDPARDTLTKLNKYVHNFHPDFYAARGEEESISPLTRELGVVYARVSMPNGEAQNSYDIDHTGTVILFNPQGKVQAFFTTPHDANLLAKDYEALVAH